MQTNSGKQNSQPTNSQWMPVDLITSNSSWKGATSSRLKSFMSKPQCHRGKTWLTESRGRLRKAPNDSTQKSRDFALRQYPSDMIRSPSRQDLPHLFMLRERDIPS